MQPLSPDDLAFCMVGSLENPKASRKIFEIGGPEVFTYDQAIKMVASYLGKEGFKISYTSFGVAKAMAYIFNWIKPGSFLQPDWIELLTFPSVADPKPIKETFGIELKGIKGYLEEHLKGKG
jgi:nucleoside-diphosphate-sugar epimerase